MSVARARENAGRRPPDTCFPSSPNLSPRAEVGINTGCAMRCAYEVGMLVAITRRMGTMNLGFGRLDFTKPEEPSADSDMRKLLTSWLDYQRATFCRKLRDLEPAGIVEMAIPPLELSILGLVRHMTQMEHVY